MSRKSTLSPESAAVIKHLKEHGRCTAAVLCMHFAAMSRKQLLKRLGNLVDLGWLDFDRTDSGDKVWFVRSSARAVAVHTTEPKEPPSATAALPVALPRRVNVMSGTYVPPRGPALRAGAMDFRNCPSVGYRC
jgi:hypothetical protein